MRSLAKRLLSLLRPVWRGTGAPVHQTLFKRYFVAILERLDAAATDIVGIRGDLGEVREQQEELDRRVRTMAASRADATAMSRRLAALEDRVAALDAAADGHRDPTR